MFGCSAYCILLTETQTYNDMHYLIIKGHFNVIRDFHIYIIFIMQTGIQVLFISASFQKG